jgi:hypothetical protein
MYSFYKIITNEKNKFFKFYREGGELLSEGALGRVETVSFFPLSIRKKCFFNF